MGRRHSEVESEEKIVPYKVVGGREEYVKVDINGRQYTPPEVSARVLLLGTVGLGVVMMRNVLERRSELALLRAVGYTTPMLKRIVLLENAFLLSFGLLAGTIAAAVAMLLAAPASAQTRRDPAVPMATAQRTIEQHGYKNVQNLHRFEDNWVAGASDKRGAAVVSVDRYGKFRRVSPD